MAGRVLSEADASAQVELDSGKRVKVCQRSVEIRVARSRDRAIEAAKKRPELASVSTTFRPTVPQLFLEVDQDKVLKQGVNLSDVYKTLQSFLGSGFINYFNRFGRQWQVYVQAEGDFRTNIDNVGQFYVRNNKGEAVPLSALTSVRNISGPEFTVRYNLYRSAQINASAAPGDSSASNSAATDEGTASTTASAGRPRTSSMACSTMRASW